MSLARSITFDPIDIGPASHYEEVDPSLRLNDFLNNPRPVGKIPADELQYFVIEEGYGESERQLFSALGELVVTHNTRPSSREVLTQGMTDYGDRVFSILKMPTHERGSVEVTSLIAVEGLFLFGHAHYTAQLEGETRETSAYPLSKPQVDHFLQFANIE